MVNIFNKLMEVREIAHQLHLSKSETQAAHEALEEFYTDLLEHMDLFIEIWQGQMGLIDNFGEFKEVDSSDMVKYFTDFAEFMQDNRKEITEEATHLNTLFDEIIISTYKLLYKLKYLK